MSVVPGDAARDRLAEALGRHYAEGRLGTAELDERLRLVYSDSSDEQAATVLADLPPLSESDPRSRRRWWGRRHGEVGSPRAGWLPTTERFRDPASGRIMRVWLDPLDSQRHYVAESA